MHSRLPSQHQAMLSVDTQSYIGASILAQPGSSAAKVGCKSQCVGAAGDLWRLFRRARVHFGDQGADQPVHPAKVSLLGNGAGLGVLRTKPELQAADEPSQDKPKHDKCYEEFEQGETSVCRSRRPPPRSPAPSRLHRHQTLPAPPPPMSGRGRRTG